MSDISKYIEERDEQQKWLMASVLKEAGFSDSDVSEKLSFDKTKVGQAYKAFREAVLPFVSDIKQYTVGVLCLKAARIAQMIDIEKTRETSVLNQVKIIKILTETVNQLEGNLPGTDNFITILQKFTGPVEEKKIKKI